MTEVPLVTCTGCGVRNNTQRTTCYHCGDALPRIPSAPVVGDSAGVTSAEHSGQDTTLTQMQSQLQPVNNYKFTQEKDGDVTSAPTKKSSLKLLVCGVVIAVAIWFNFIKNQDFADCIFDKLPSAANDVTAIAIHRQCLTQFPGGLYTIQKKTGMSVDECIIKYAGKTQSRSAGGNIASVCGAVYSKPATGIFDDVIKKPDPVFKWLKPFNGKLDQESTAK